MEQYSQVRQMALDSHFLMSGSLSSIDTRMAQVERLQYQVGEIVCSIIINEYVSSKHGSRHLK